MFLFHRPSEAEINAFLDRQRAQRRFSYKELGLTRTASAPGGFYDCDHNRIQLGSGSQAFARACNAIHAWKMFEVPQVQLCWPAARIQPGATVAVLARHLGFYSLNGARIIYVINDEQARIRRFGFAYGTLPGHVESGEERFLIEWDRRDDSVWYDLFAFSRPARFLVGVAKPFARLLQKRFARESKQAMLRAVQR